MKRATMQTQILSANDAGLSLSSLILQRGGLVAFPTETVYGLGADARNDKAVAAIFAAKGRPSFNPLIVHVQSLPAATEFADFSPLAFKLAQAFWPGPLSLVLPLLKGGQLSHLVSAGMPSVAIRIPAHPVAQGLLQVFGGPIAAPSANPSGQISPTTPGHVTVGLKDRIDAILDGGLCSVGVESTILGVSDDDVTLLRPGGISVEQIAKVIGFTPTLTTNETTPNSPGQLLSHYAPKADIVLNVTDPEPEMMSLGFGNAIAHPTLNLSPKGDLTEAAANLFAHLHALDAMANADQCIAVAPIPMTGLGLAINDRLTRAAAPRDGQ